MPFPGPVGTQRMREVENMNSFGTHTVSPGKVPSAKPLGRSFGTDSQSLDKAVSNELTIFRQKLPWWKRTARQFDTARQLRIPTNLVWTLAIENS